MEKLCCFERNVLYVLVRRIPMENSKFKGN